METRAVLYLDIDDTILRHENGSVHPAPGSREFLRWALERFEVRWLTRWCPGGEMSENLMRDFCKLFELDLHTVRAIRGSDWDGCESKVNGITWVEHLVLDRPFFWIEDEHGVGDFELAFLASHGFADAHFACNVTRQPEALLSVWERLRTEVDRDAA